MTEFQYFFFYLGVFSCTLLRVFTILLHANWHIFFVKSLLDYKTKLNLLLEVFYIGWGFYPFKITSNLRAWPYIDYRVLCFSKVL